jgi:dipeptidyl aminopeptidase/acylaminoacyl peptidase
VPEYRRELSMAYNNLGVSSADRVKVTERAAPALLVRGDKDELVPVEHSRNIPVLEKAKVLVKLVVVEGAGHAFTPKQSTEVIVPAVTDWFEKYLAERREK